MRWRECRICLALLVPLVIQGCATEKLDCFAPPEPCPDSVTSCDSPPDACRTVPLGATHAMVVIDSSPTPAAIYVDGTLIGNSPLSYPLYYSGDTRNVSVVADPLYPNQSRQERRIEVPPIPDRIHFFMSMPAVDRSSEEKTN